MFYKRFQYTVRITMAVSVWAAAPVLVPTSMLTAVEKKLKKFWMMKNLPDTVYAFGGQGFVNPTASFSLRL